MANLSYRPGCIICIIYKHIYPISIFLPSYVQHPHNIVRMTKSEMLCSNSFFMMIPSFISVIRMHKKVENRNVSQSGLQSPFRIHNPNISLYFIFHIAISRLSSA